MCSRRTGIRTDELPPPWFRNAVCRSLFIALWKYVRLLSNAKYARQRGILIKAAKDVSSSDGFSRTSRLRSMRLDSTKFASLMVSPASDIVDKADELRFRALFGDAFCSSTPISAVASAPSNPPTRKAATTASSRSLESGTRSDIDAASRALTTKKASTIGRNRAKSAAIAHEAPALLPSITVPSPSSDAPAV